ncbi:hypothetical protein G7Y89_g915 [Cudoniella acicularis]|uniref:Uncharacterized protein n=1 Tax=Cudoniella acicularis TaxID=354080 RepID=A0A8H4RX50_9HELO|nr:hypothetical protein G7Y89_g915 [Cudoniella acicularis]
MRSQTVQRLVTLRAIGSAPPSINMPAINEQPAQVAEQMTTQSTSVEASQPSVAPQMSTSGDVSMRGGEEQCGCQNSIRYSLFSQLSVRTYSVKDVRGAADQFDVMSSCGWTLPVVPGVSVARNNKVSAQEGRKNPSPSIKFFKHDWLLWELNFT